MNITDTVDANLLLLSFPQQVPLCCSFPISSLLSKHQTSSGEFLFPENKQPGMRHSCLLFPVMSSRGTFSRNITSLDKYGDRFVTKSWPRMEGGEEKDEGAGR